MKFIYLILIFLVIIYLIWRFMSKRIIYLDNCATTKPLKKILKIRKKYHKKFYNISNPLSVKITEIKREYDQNIFDIASIFNINPDELILTSGASESNATAIKCISKGLFETTKKNPIIITSPTEHKSIIESCGCVDCGKVIYVKVNENGGVDAKTIADILKKTREMTTVPIILSIMGANNETGVINDLPEIGKLCKKYDTIFHSDMTQLIGKMPKFHPEDFGIHSFSMSLHKINGPKSLGILYVSNKIPGFKSLIGGSQFGFKRGGTYNPENAEITLFCLRRMMKNRLRKNRRLLEMRNLISSNLSKIFSEYGLTNGIYEYCLGIPNRLPHVIYYSLPNIICAEDFIKYMDSHNIILGMGSACNEGKRSHILDVIPVKKQFKDDIIRISLGDTTSMSDCEKFIKHVDSYIKSIKFKF